LLHTKLVAKKQAWLKYFVKIHYFELGLLPGFDFLGLLHPQKEENPRGKGKIQSKIQGL